MNVFNSFTFNNSFSHILNENIDSEGLDDLYFKSISMNDMKTANYLVRKKAIENGYKEKAYHGTILAPFSEFSTTISFFSSSKEVALTYAEGKDDVLSPFNADFMKIMDDDSDNHEIELRRWAEIVGYDLNMVSRETVIKHIENDINSVLMAFENGMIELKDINAGSLDDCVLKATGVLSSISNGIYDNLNILTRKKLARVLTRLRELNIKYTEYVYEMLSLSVDRKSREFSIAKKTKNAYSNFFYSLNEFLMKYYNAFDETADAFYFDGKKYVSYEDIFKMAKEAIKKDISGKKYSAKGIYEAYLNTDNFYMIDAGGKDWMGISINGMCMNAAEVGLEALKRGYAGCIIHDVIDAEYNGKKIIADDFIVNDKKRIKSSDTITYSNLGKIIPLSQRFNPDNPDIRY